MVPVSLSLYLFALDFFLSLSHSLSLALPISIPLRISGAQVAEGAAEGGDGAPVAEGAAEGGDGAPVAEAAAEGGDWLEELSRHFMGAEVWLGTDPSVHEDSTFSLYHDWQPDLVHCHSMKWIS